MCRIVDHFNDGYVMMPSFRQSNFPFLKLELNLNIERILEDIFNSES